MREPTTCGLCPWEQVFPTDDDAARGLAKHRQVRHGENPINDVVQPSPVQWRERAIEAVRIVAARGEDFAFYEALEPFGIGEPPTNPQHAWGRFAKDVHRLGIAHPVDYELSRRPGTNASSVRKWNADPARCETHGRAVQEGRTA